MKDIGTVLQLDYGTLSPLLKRLEAAGLVNRSRRPDDERSVEIALTEAGAAMRGDANAVPGAIRCALGIDDDSAVADLQTTLRQLTDSVNAAASAGS